VNYFSDSLFLITVGSDNALMYKCGRGHSSSQTW